MKETQDLQPDRTEVHAQREVEKQLAYHGSLRRHKGQQVWELNVATQEIALAEYEAAVADFAAVVKEVMRPLRHKLIMREGCLYCVAINATNARKKFVKMLFAHYVHKA